MSRKSNLEHFFILELEKEIKFGQSKHEAKQDAFRQSQITGEKYKPVRGIYSHETFKYYKEATHQFVKWIVSNHQNIHSIQACFQYIKEYLNYLIENKYSAWTIHLRASALASAYHVRKKAFGIKLPPRRRKDIIRSRLPTKADASLNDDFCQHFRAFARSIGARREGLFNLCVDDYRERKEGGMEVFLREKNGKTRWARVLPAHEKSFTYFMFENNTGYQTKQGKNKVFLLSQIPKRMDIHGERSSYASELYLQFWLEGMGTGEKYICQRDLKGMVFDKGILRLVSLNLGHNRCNVVVSNYLRISIFEEMGYSSIIKANTFNCKVNLQDQ